MLLTYRFPNDYNSYLLYGDPINANAIFEDANVVSVTVKYDDGSSIEILRQQR